MKFTLKEAIEALKKLGVEAAEAVDNEGDSTYNETELLTAVDASRGAIITPKIKAALTEEIGRATAGKVGTMLERDLVRGLGVDKKLFVDGMKDEEKIKVAVDAYLAASSKGTEELQGEITRITKDFDTKKTEMQAEFDRQLAAEKKRFTDRDMLGYYQGKLTKAPMLEGADKGYWAEIVQKHMDENYHVVYDEATKTPKYFQKDKHDLPAYANAEQNKLLEDDEVIKNILTKAGVYQTDGRNRNPQQPQQPPHQQYQSGKETIINGNGNNDQANKWGEDRRAYIQSKMQGQQ